MLGQQVVADCWDNKAGGRHGGAGGATKIGRAPMRPKTLKSTLSLLWVPSESPESPPKNMRKCFYGTAILFCSILSPHDMFIFPSYSGHILLILFLSPLSLHDMFIFSLLSSYRCRRVTHALYSQIQCICKGNPCICMVICMYVCMYPCMQGTLAYVGSWVFGP